MRKKAKKAKDIIRKFDLTDEELAAKVNEALGGGTAPLEGIYEDSVKNFEVDSILRGRILDVINDDVIVDIGHKSEGIININEFEDPSATDPGDQVEVLLESVEDEMGEAVLWKKKADRQRDWERILAETHEGDKVKGRVLRRIKGGLLVDIGVPVFLPASQVSIRRQGDIAEWIGKDIEAKVIKINEARMDIVISRRKLIEDERDEMKRKLLDVIQVGDVRRGTVIEIADRHVLIDLGGLNGVMSVTDISWGRIRHPSDVLLVDDELDVKVLKVNKEGERIWLGLRQLTPSPWENVEEKYLPGTRVTGRVRNLTKFGAFVEIEEGIEGLLHVSEMSWTKKIAHPSELMNEGDVVEAVVLSVDRDKMRIALGMKQLDEDPWQTEIPYRYKVGTRAIGTVARLANFGVFVALEENLEGLLHISEITNREDADLKGIVSVGDKIEVRVLRVDAEQRKIALSMATNTEFSPAGSDADQPADAGPAEAPPPP